MYRHIHLYFYLYLNHFLNWKGSFYLLDTTKLLFVIQSFPVSLALFFLDKFNIIMGVKLFLKLGEPSNIITPVAKLETYLILQQNHNSDVWS